MNLIDVELKERKIFELGVRGGRRMRRKETGSGNIVAISHNSLGAAADRQPGAGERIPLFASRFDQQERAIRCAVKILRVLGQTAEQQDQAGWFKGRNGHERNKWIARFIECAKTPGASRFDDLSRKSG